MSLSFLASGLAGFADIAPWLVFCGVMFVLSAPVVRRAPTTRRRIAATPQEIWPLLQPSGWAAYAHWKHIENLQLADPERRVWTFVERAPLHRARRITLAQRVYSEFGLLEEAVVATDDKPTPTKKAACTRYRIEPCEGGSRVTMEHEAVSLNLGGYWLARKAQERHLSALASYLYSQKPEPQSALTLEFRGAAWLLVLFLPYVAKALFGADMTAPAIFAGAVVAAILLRELGHAAASLAFGRKKIVIALSPLTGAATMRARAFRSKAETAVVSLSGPAVAAAAALMLTPAIDRVARAIAAAEDSAYAAAWLGDKLDLYCTAVATVVMTLNLLALIPFRSSLGAIIIQSVARGTAPRLALVTADFAAAAMVFPGVGPDLWPTLVASLLPPLLLWLVLWNVSGDADGFAPLPRRQAMRLVGSLAVVFVTYGIVKAPLRAPLANMSRAAIQHVDDGMQVEPRRHEQDV